jgi:hypothetical protein
MRKKFLDWSLPIVLVTSLLMAMGNLKRTEDVTPKEAQKIVELTRDKEQSQVAKGANE